MVFRRLRVLSSTLGEEIGRVCNGWNVETAVTLIRGASESSESYPPAEYRAEFSFEPLSLLCGSLVDGGNELKSETDKWR